MAFKRDISSFGILCVSLGGIVGSGWLFGSLFAAQMAGPAALISWVIGGVCTLFLALTYAEISTMFPVSGGLASIPIFTHGKLVGFLLTWITWVTYVVSIAQEVQSTVFYLGNRYPTWVHKVEGVTQFTFKGQMIAFLVLFSLVLVNNLSARLFAKANTVVTIWKLAVPFGVVIMFLFYTWRHPVNTVFTATMTTHEFMPYGFNGVLSAVALAGVAYSFSGFQHGAILAGEARNPQRAVPIALVGSISICLLLYCGLQYAFIQALPTNTLMHGWHQLGFVGDSGPLAGLAAMLGLTTLVGILYVDSIISPLGTGILYLASSARIVQNMGASGSAPRFLARLNRFGVPFRAILFNFLIASLAFLPFKGWQSIVSFLSSAMVFSFAVGPLCLVALRKQHPNYRRPFRLPCYRIFSFLAFYVCNLMIFWSGFDVIWKLTFTLVLGVITFVAAHVLNKKPFPKKDFISALWLFPYIGSFCILAHYSSFAGGIGLIPLGIDFAFVFVLSLFAFMLAHRMRLEPADSKRNMDAILVKSSHP